LPLSGALGLNTININLESKMKRIYSAIFVCSMFSNLAFAEVNSEDLNNIRNLVKNEQYELALQKHVWFHEESKSSSGMAGVRLSYALSAWLKLGDKYPPALDELRKIRDNNKDKMYSGTGTFNNFHDLSAINRELGEETQTIELFSVLSERFPEQAKSFYHAVEDLLIQKQEFKLVKMYMEDPIFKYESLRYSLEQSLSYDRKNPDSSSKVSRDYNNNRFVEETIKLINALLILDKKLEAIEIHSRATSYFKSEKLKGALVSTP
jgi:hypothetical protein